MNVLPRRVVAVVATTAILIGGGAAYALSSGPSNDDARAALKTLNDYVDAHASDTSGGTVTVTADPSETYTTTETITRTPSPTTATTTETTTVTVTGNPSPTTTPPDTTTPPTSSTPTGSTTPPAEAKWFSGASSRYAANGTFGTWRGEPVGILGTWSDTKGCAETACSLDYTENKNLGPNMRLDLAVAAIWKEETWAQAAAGNFDTRWRTQLQHVKTKSAALGLLPQNVYLRFAHEMNGSWVDWRVPVGQEANFRAALTRYSNLRYEVFGTSNAAKLVLCPNDGTSGGYANPRNLFVSKDGSGRRVVDVYAIDSYNSWPHRTNATDVWNDLNDTSAADSHESHRLFAELQGVPFAIGEWGNCGIASQCDGGGGESPAYVQQLNRYLRAHAGDVNNPKPGQVLYDVQFNLWTQYALYGPEANQPQTSTAYAAQVWGQ